MVEELDLADADNGRAAALFLDPQRAHLVGGHARDPGLAPGREQIGDVFPLPGPAGHDGGDAVLEIVRVSHHGDGPVPVLRYRLHPPQPSLPGDVGATLSHRRPGQARTVRAVAYGEGWRRVRCPSWSKMHKPSAGPPWAPKACGIMVENSAAWPASTRMVRSPSSSTMVPDRTVNQSLPGWTRSSSLPARGSGLVIRILATDTPCGPGSRVSIQVVTPREVSRCGLITTSSSSADSTSWSRVVPRARAMGASWSRAIRRWPVSIRLKVEGLR